MKQKQAQQNKIAQATQVQNQPAQTQNMQGGTAVQNDVKLCFITFTHKLSREKTKEILKHLRQQFPQAQFVFSRRIPAGRKRMFYVDGELVIVTIPYSKQETPTQEQASGFTLEELIKKPQK
jgi:hypothetical protein